MRSVAAGILSLQGSLGLHPKTQDGADGPGQNGWHHSGERPLGEGVGRTVLETQTNRASGEGTAPRRRTSLSVDSAQLELSRGQDGPRGFLKNGKLILVLVLEGAL